MKSGEVQVAERRFITGGIMSSVFFICSKRQTQLPKRDKLLAWKERIALRRKRYYSAISCIQNTLLPLMPDRDGAPFNRERR